MNNRPVVIFYKQLLERLSIKGLHVGWTERERAVYDKLYDWYIYDVYINSGDRCEY